MNESESLNAIRFGRMPRLLLGVVAVLMLLVVVLSSVVVAGQRKISAQSQKIIKLEAARDGCSHALGEVMRSEHCLFAILGGTDAELIKGLEATVRVVENRDVLRVLEQYRRDIGRESETFDGTEPTYPELVASLREQLQQSEGKCLQLEQELEEGRNELSE
ncbi:hypothetical protein Poly24_04080 [Rosistilla carotiformis]|uniref:Uncharacterized protein n=1 Tax=Rosistilla carotiformis TaxID=2528017 RepID=A0A518JMF3_9BACT|nr:hypothetical protein [Rosistilla carotiformis]QDV66721.1 hypothetical protein Poly24_04080 [Rosistilla carotiformis]